MAKFYLIALFFFLSIPFAQDQTIFKNALGWESGLSYRRYLNKTIWVGLNLTGSYDNMLTTDTQSGSYTTIADDSTSTTSTFVKDTTRTYSGTVKIELGKEIFRYKKLDLDVFAAVGYTLTDSKSFQGGTSEISTYLNESLSHSFLGIIALEPKIFLWDRISIGTQVGLQYTYTNSKYNYNNQYSTSMQTRVSSESKSTFDNNIRLFGNVSLSSALVFHFYY